MVDPDDAAGFGVTGQKHLHALIRLQLGTQAEPYAPLGNINRGRIADGTPVAQEHPQFDGHFERHALAGSLDLIGHFTISIIQPAARNVKSFVA
jgi:hypothetical protein